MAAWMQASFFVLWLAAVAFYAISTWCLASFYRRASQGRPTASGPTDCPPMTVLKPVRGADGDTYENLESFILQDYPAFQVLIGVAEPDDPAAEVARQLIAAHPGADVSLVTGHAEDSPNLKAGNLAGMYTRAKYDILVVADADMRVGPGYLRALANGFEDPRVGLVTCPYRGAYPSDMGSAFEALTIDTDFLPSVAVAERLEGMSFALGATMAVRREALEAIGGFRALSPYLADDYMLGNLVKRAGYGLFLSGYVVDAVERAGSVKGYFAHQLRWGRTYRACRPKGYFLSVLTKGTAFAAFFLLSTGFSLAGWSVFMADILIRGAQALYIEARYIRGPGVRRYLWLLPLKDLIGFALWFMSFTGNKVTWKGTSFMVDREGRLVRL